MESHIRSIAKAITWRSGGTFVTFMIAWIITGEPTLSVSIGIFDAIVKVAAFYIHERIWMKLKFGKMKKPEYEI